MSIQGIYHHPFSSPVDHSWNACRFFFFNSPGVPSFFSLRDKLWREERGERREASRKKETFRMKERERPGFDPSTLAALRSNAWRIRPLNHNAQLWNKSKIQCYWVGITTSSREVFKLQKRIIYFGLKFFSCGNCWVKFEKKNPGKSLDLNSIKVSINVFQIRFFLLCTFHLEKDDVFQIRFSLLCIFK